MINSLIYRLYFFLLLVVISLSSCDKEEPIPSYIYIPSFSVEESVDFGTNSSKITEAWVYANNALLGVYPMPAIVPILEEGTTELQIFAGIHENGILDRPTPYPFYKPIILNHHLVPGEIDTLPLVTKYFSAEEITSIILDFEISNFLTDDLDEDTTTFVTIIDEGFEGKAGQLIVQDTSFNLSVGNSELFTLPANGSKVFMEMNYRNNVPFSVWFRGHKQDFSGDIQILSALNVKDEWNKIYIPLTEFVNFNKWIDYQLVFNVKLTQEQIDAGEKGEVILDNIKILKFK